MPLRVSFHERDTFPLHRVRNDHERPIAPHRQRFVKRLRRMAVDLQRLPSERFPFLTLRCKGHHLLRRAIVLQAIMIHDGDEIPAGKMSRRLRRFPYRSLITLSIADNDEDAGILIPFTPQPQSTPDAQGKPLPQTAAGKLHPRNGRAGGMRR